MNSVSSRAILPYCLPQIIIRFCAIFCSKFSLCYFICFFPTMEMGQYLHMWTSSWLWCKEGPVLSKTRASTAKMSTTVRTFEEETPLWVLTCSTTTTTSASRTRAQKEKKHSDDWRRKPTLVQTNPVYSGTGAKSPQARRFLKTETMILFLSF